jgi:hypothetical protein
MESLLDIAQQHIAKIEQAPDSQARQHLENAIRAAIKNYNNYARKVNQPAIYLDPSDLPDRQSSSQ